MDNENFKISIPKPCHEDWNKMTPNEKGAFCKLCSKSVIDFTKNTVQEIKEFLLEKNTEKICGRVLNTQLSTTSSKTIGLYIPLHLLPRNLSLNKLFVIALFVSFGTTLFSCNTQQGEIVGKISAVVDSIQKTDSLVKGNSTIIDSVQKNEVQIKELKSIKECTPLQGDVAIERTLGEIEQPIVNDRLTIESDTVEKIMMVGKMKMEKE